MVLWNRTPYSPLSPSFFGLPSQAEALMGLLNAPASVPTQGAPAVNLRGSEKQLTLTALLPGYGPDDVDLQVEGNVLVLASKDSGEAREVEGLAPFRRSLRLPYRIDPDSVEALLRHGELTVSAMRHTADAPRTVQVRGLAD